MKKTMLKYMNYIFGLESYTNYGHDLRYALDGTKMANMGWKPQSAFQRLESVIKWTLDNDRWLIT